MSNSQVAAAQLAAAIKATITVDSEFSVEGIDGLDVFPDWVQASISVSEAFELADKLNAISAPQEIPGQLRLF